jgi:hypothetical protein
MVGGQKKFMACNPLWAGILGGGIKSFCKIIWRECVHPYLCNPLRKKEVLKRRKKRAKFLEMRIICKERRDKKREKKVRKSLDGKVRNPYLCSPKKTNSSSKYFESD